MFETNLKRIVLLKAQTGNLYYNNNGNGTAEMTSRQRREANLGIVLISISGTNDVL